MPGQPHATLRVTTDQPRCTVVFEPWGSEYELAPDDSVLVHLFEGSKRPEDADVEVVHQHGRILLWLPDNFTAWNKAGVEIPV